MSGFQGTYTVEDFTSGKLPSGDQHRIYLALRRAHPEAPFQWTAVRGLRLHLSEKRWQSLKLFSYRDGRVVFIAEEETGLSLAAASTLPRARARLTGDLADMTLEALQADLAKTFKTVDPGPKPTVRLKNRI